MLRSIKPKRKLDAKFIKIAWAAGVLSFIMMLFHGLRNQFWIDEGFSIQAIQLGWREMISLTAADVHPPLYYIYLKSWSLIFGLSSLSLRLSSIVLMILVVVVLMAITYRYFSARAAIFTGLILALSPYFLRLSFEIRMYSLAMLALSLMLLFYLEARSSPKKIWPILVGICAALAMYTHYYSVFMIISLLLIELIDVKFSPKAFLNQTKLLLGGVLAGLLYLPWISTFIEQTKKLGGGFWVPKPKIYSLFYEPINFISGIDEFWYQHRLAISTAMLMAVLILLNFKKIIKFIKDADPALKFMLAIFAVSSLIMFILSLVMESSVFYPRYLSLSAFIAFVVAAGVILSLIKNKLRMITISATVVLLILGQLHFLAWGNASIYGNTPVLYKDAVAVQCALGPNSQKPSIYITEDPSAMDSLQYYLNQAGATNYRLIIKQWPSSEPWQELWSKRLVSDGLVTVLNQQQINDVISSNKQSHNVWYLKAAKNGYQFGDNQGGIKFSKICTYDRPGLTNYIVNTLFLVAP